MDHGTLSGEGRQKQRHQKRPQRLGSGTRQAALYSGFAVEHRHGESGDDEGREGGAETGVCAVGHFEPLG